MDEIARSDPRSNISVFIAPTGAEIRALEIDGEPWFVGRDVAQALGYIHARRSLKQHCGEDKRFARVVDNMGRPQQARVISADDVLSLLYGSKLSIAPELKRWIVNDLLGRGAVYNQALADEGTWSSFTSPAGAAIRAKEIDGEPWFVGRDIALALGYSNPNDAIAAHCGDGVTGGSGGRYTALPSGVKGLRLISEGDMYSLVLASKMPEAKAFKHWVTHEVLPSLRKHGGYMVNVEGESDEQFLARAVALANDLLARKNKELEEARPKIVFADAVADSDSLILVGDLAKIIKQNGEDIGQNRMYAWLRSNGYIMMGSCTPTQYAMELGLFRVVERLVTKPDGSQFVARTTKVTGKGQSYFINKFKGGKGASK